MLFHFIYHRLQITGLRETSCICKCSLLLDYFVLMLISRHTGEVNLWTLPSTQKPSFLHWAEHHQVPHTILTLSMTCQAQGPISPIFNVSPTFRNTGILSTYIGTNNKIILRWTTAKVYWRYVKILQAKNHNPTRFVFSTSNLLLIKVINCRTERTMNF